MQDIQRMHRRVQDNLKLATSVFVSDDRDLARKLLLEKEHFRVLERNAAESHHERLKSGMRESLETSSLHLDILRDLKRINSHLSSVAYPILEQAGELRASRLRERARETGPENSALNPS
jgi:phosphate:Na+ symporter